MNDLQAQIYSLIADRDRARDIAVHLEQENAHLRDTLHQIISTAETAALEPPL